jgi:hypothetical protein
VKSTRGKGDDSGILRIDFPGYSNSGSLEEISWEEFFERFDREKLALIYQDNTARGQKSNFNKIISGESVTACAAGKRSAAGRSSGGAARETGRKRSGPAAKKPARRSTGGAKGSAARKRSGAAKSSARRPTGRKAAKRGSRSR